MWKLIIEILFFVITVITVFLMPVGIPGNFIGSGLLLIYGLIFPVSRIAWWLILICFALSVFGEIVESIMGFLGAKHYGAGKAGMAASFIGGIAGGILGSLILPVIGTLIGVLTGGFILTFIVEAFIVKKDITQGARAGFGAMLGRVISINVKYMMGLIIIVIMMKGFWL